MAAVPTPTLKDPKYINWIRAGVGLLVVKRSITPATMRIIQDIHRAMGGVPTPVPSAMPSAMPPTAAKAPGCSCTFKDIDFRKKCMKTGCAICNPFVQAILAAHKFPTIFKDNCDPCKWSTYPWEVAKAFMGPGQQKDNHDAEHTDCSNLILLWENCSHFTHISDKHLLKKVRDARNAGMHSPKMTLSDAEMKAAFEAMINLLKDATLSKEADIDTSSGVSELEKIRDQGMSISFEDETKVWVDQVKSLSTSVKQLMSENEYVAALMKMNQQLQGTVSQELQGLQNTMSNVEHKVAGLVKAMEAKSKDQEDDTLERLRAELVETYVGNYSNMQPVPWSADVSLPIKLVYQEQTVTERKGASSQHHGSSDLKSIFETNGEELSRPGRILIQGPPGIGKSTLTQRLIQSWAQRVNAAPTEAASWHQATSQDDMEDSRLHDFQLVFLIRVRDLIRGDLTVNLQENLINSCWKENALEERLKSCIYKNIEQVLLIVDGYDEGDEAQRAWVDMCLRGTDCRGCMLIVTSRPGFYQPTAKPEQNPNRTYTLMGLDRAKQQDFARKFDQEMGLEPGKRSASEQLSHFQDQDFLQTPLLLAFACVLASQGEGALPKTVSALYNKFTEFLSLKAMHASSKLNQWEVSKLLKFLQQIAFNLFKQKKSEIHSDLLKEHVSETEIEKTMHNLCKLELVQQKIKLKGCRNNQTVEFIHQSFLDFFAARHFVSASKEKRSALLEDIPIRENMLVLAAGLCGESEGLSVECEKQHRKCFGQMLDAWDRSVQREVKEEEEEEEEEEEKLLKLLGPKSNHSVRHACFLWLNELRDPCWLCADHISAIYQTSNKESHGDGIRLNCIFYCTASCWQAVTALLEAAQRHTLHGSHHAPCDPATFKSTVYIDGTCIPIASQLDLLDAALLCNVQLDCRGLYLLPDCLTHAGSDQLAVILPRLTSLWYLSITTSSLTALNALLRAVSSTSQLRGLDVTCSPSSPRDSPPAAAASAEDPWSPTDELLDNISRFSALMMIVFTDIYSTVTEENRRAITRRISNRLPRVKVVIKGIIHCRNDGHLLPWYLQALTVRSAPSAMQE